MKIYEIITTCCDNKGKYVTETTIDSADEVKAAWNDATEEAELCLEDWNSIKVQLVSYEVRYEQVSFDPELIESERILETVVCEQIFNQITTLSKQTCQTLFAK